jgi:cytochrome c biogenesis protein CcdA
MPMSFRPKVQKLISNVTSPVGAFLVGVVITLFLLPCTIGPYVILGNILSVNSVISSIPLLLLYNIIFIIPMLIITFVVYFGITEVQKVGEWKQRNIKYFHLVAGIILLALSVLMFFGLI